MPFRHTIRPCWKSVSIPGRAVLAALPSCFFSLYNEQCGFSFGECVSGLDDRLTGVALRMVQDYSARGETEDLRSAGKILVVVRHRIDELADEIDSLSEGELLHALVDQFER